MPSIFGHSATGAAVSYVCKTLLPNINFKKFLILSVVAANIPDIDIFLFQSPLGQYEAFFHRNFLHSLLFAVLFGFAIGYGFYSKLSTQKKLQLSLYFFLVTASHDVLDAFTEGFGVAFFYPFDKTQYNFPITPLNPAGWNITEFHANNALGREFLIVWLPMMVFSFLVYFWRKYKSKKGI